MEVNSYLDKNIMLLESTDSGEYQGRVLVLSYYNI